MNDITENFSLNMQGTCKDTISENFAKTRRRGRPSIVVVEADPYHIVRSRRCLIDQSYATHALDVIGDGREPEFNWLADAQAGKYRRTVLAELGRIDDEDQLLDVAFDVCEQKLKTAAAVALIRSRRGAQKPATQDSITRCLKVSINRWRAGNPSGTWAQVHEALRVLSVAVEGRLKRQQAAAASASGSTPQSPG